MRGLLLSALLALPAHAQFWARLANPDVQVTLTHPPDLGLPLLPVAVVPTDEAARELADGLRAELAGGGAKLVDPGAIAWACAGEHLSAPDSGMLARLQRRLGGSVLLLATVTRAEVQQTRSSHGGKENGTSVTFQQADSRIAFEGRLQAGDLVSGRLFPAVPFSAEPHASAESSQGPPSFPDPAPLRSQALAGVRASARRMLQPWDETLKVICFDDAAYGMEKVHGRIKARDLDGAWDLAQQGLQAARADAKGESKYRARAIHDAGLVAWLRGRPGEAQQLFQEALNLLPDASITRDALKDAAHAEDVAGALAHWRALASAGIEAAQPDLRADGASPEARLKALKGLRDQGLINEADYEAKKADILKGL
jgi:hypothetical protein